MKLQLQCYLQSSLGWLAKIDAVFRKKIKALCIFWQNFKARFLHPQVSEFSINKILILAKVKWE